MSEKELTPVDLQKYAQKIREDFNVTEESPIDYEYIGSVESEIERRREILKYFIPDVFITTKYDRRADIIDACIFYLAKLMGQGEHNKILGLWAKRAGFSKRFRRGDVEQDLFGYGAYHPLYHTLGDFRNPQNYLPRIVQHIQPFRGRKRKLDINDYNFIFSGVFTTVPGYDISEKMFEFLTLLHKEIEKVPLTNAIDLRQFMQDNGFGDIRSFHAEFVRLGVRVHPVYERSGFGLGMYVIHCPYPYHCKLELSRGLFTQNLLTSGEHYTQEIMLGLPLEINWKLLSRKFPSASKITRMTRFPNRHQAFLKYFNHSTQEWEVPWEKIIADWKESIDSVDQSNKPVEPEYDVIIPNQNFLKVASLLEVEGNLRNKEIHDKTHIPLDEIRQYRRELDEKTLVMRALYLFHSNLNEFCVLQFSEGVEEWKYNLLKQIAEVFPYYFIWFVEDLKRSRNYLMGEFVQSPKLGIKFMRYFPEVFEDSVEYTLLKRTTRPRLDPASVYEWFDSKTESWEWDPEDVMVKPIFFKRT